MHWTRNRRRGMERPMDIRARGSGKSHGAETPIELHRRIYRPTRCQRQQPDSQLRRSGPPPANIEIQPALPEKMPRARACEDELAGIEWPIRGVASVAQCVPEKHAGH